MTHPIPVDVREASRVILIDSRERILLCRGEEPVSKRCFWVMPGGGLDAGETYEDAAVREIFEETGISVEISQCVWHRRHRHIWNGRCADQFEKFFVARVAAGTVVDGCYQDDYITEYRWWNSNEIRDSVEDFAPRRLSEFLPAIIEGNIPDDPIDCGI